MINAVLFIGGFLMVALLAVQLLIKDTRQSR